MTAIAGKPFGIIRTVKTRGVEILASGFLADARRLAAGTFCGQLIGFVASPVLTRIFSPDDFGIYSTLLAATMVIAAFVALRVEELIPATPRPLAALHLVQFMISLSVVASVLALFGILLLGHYWARLLSIPKSGAAVLVMLPVLLIAFGFYSGVRAWSVRQARFADIGRAQTFRAAVMVAVPAVIGITGFVQIPGFLLALGQALGLFAFAALLLRSFNQRELLILATPSWRKIKSTVNANSGMVRATSLSQIISTIYGRLPILVIASAYGPLEAGFYALADRVVTAPTALVSRAIGDVYRQRAAKMHREGGTFNILFRKVAMVTFTLAAVPYTIAFVVIPPHMRMIFGGAWETAAFTMSMLLISAGFSFWTTALDNTAIIVGARGYMILGPSLRLAMEGGAALAALRGALGYEDYLIWLVSGRVLLYISDIVVNDVFSRRGEGF